MPISKQIGTIISILPLFAANRWAGVGRAPGGVEGMATSIPVTPIFASDY